MNLRLLPTITAILGAALIVAAIFVPPSVLLAALRPVDTLPAALAGQLRLGVIFFQMMLALCGLVIIILSRLPLWTVPPASPHRPPFSRRNLLWLVVILLTALALRLYQLNTGLWLDEMTTYLNYVRAPFGEILTTYDSQNQHFLFSLMARSAVLIFGDTAAALRLPAVLFGLGSILALYLLGRELAGDREGLLAAALFTFSYHHIWFSQNARGYTGLLFWTILSSYFLVRGLNENRPWLWLGYAVSAALGVYTHMTMFFPIFGQFAAYAVTMLMRRKQAWPDRWHGFFLGFCLAGLLTLQLYALVLPQMTGTITSKEGNATFEEWENPLWTALEIVRGLKIGFAGGTVALIAVFVFGLGVWAWWRQRPIVLGLLFIPALFGAAVMVVTAHNLWPRFFFFAFGFGVLVVIRGVMTLGDLLARLIRQSAWLGTALAVGMVAVSVLSVPFVYGPKQDYQGAQAYLESVRQPGDVVVVAGITAFAYKDFYPTDWTVVETGAALARIQTQARRTWLLYTFPPHLKALYPDILAGVQRDFTPVERFPGTLNGGDIFVYRFDAPVSFSQ